MRQLFIAILALITLYACGRKVEKKLPGFIKVSSEGDSLRVFSVNPLKCPVQVYVSTEEEEIKRFFKNNGEFVIASQDSALLGSIPLKLYDSTNIIKAVSFNSYYGSPNVENDTFKNYAFPYPKGKAYKLMQGYNGSFSHQDPYSRYALDFSMPIGDTVCATIDGVVVGVVQKHDKGGKSKRYREYANFITLYHDNGYLSQYVHLKKNGSLVKVGDEVKQGQPIAFSGNTGFSSGPHLHFAVLKPEPRGAKSVPISFGKVRGSEMKRGINYRQGF